MNSRLTEDVQKLFEFWCEISPNKKNDKSAGYIVESFPDSFKDQKILADLAEFAYPCEFERKNIQIHSFVLTNIDSKWRFGFCRHDPKAETAMIILTLLPWHDLFIKLLNVLGDIRRTSPNEFKKFLTLAFEMGVPSLGAPKKLFYEAGNSFVFQRPDEFSLPSIPENHNLNLYYNFVEPKFMIGIFAAMLAERRIIFTSSRLDVLSCCIQAANAFLYPMVWQHIFIPVLPMKFRDTLGAPMPFLIGVPEAVFVTLRRDEIGDVVILDCDKRIMETPFDDVKNMPHELVSSLKKQLNNSADHQGDRVSKIFLGVLVQLIGNYRDAVKFNNRVTFDEETFIESRPASMRPFLRNMLQLQIFQQFIEDRLNMLNTGQGYSDEFEKETFRHADKSGKKVKYKDFLRNVKDKTNPALKSAVKSVSGTYLVKEGSRGMKTAYKGLKSKLRDSTTPPKSMDSHNNHRHHHQHNSAPSSPVFQRRAQTISNPTKINSKFFELSSPTSTIGNSNYTISDRPSPSTSHASSSNSSSEMNILQELQQHALFKSPAVNRNLKPTNSSELIQLNRSTTMTRMGAPLTIPNSTIQEVAVDALSLLEKPTNRLFITDPSVNNASQLSHSAFDSSPNVISPPVPPRQNNLKKKMNMNVPVVVPPLSSSDLLPSLARLSSSPSPSTVATVPNHNNNNVNNNYNNQAIAHKNNCLAKELSLLVKSSSVEPNINQSSNDLINLDGNSSFEIEDFDPLNDNAKPIPSYLAKSSTLPASSSSPSSQQNIPTTVLSFNNPIYPYYTPQHLKSKNQSSSNDDEDELLRRYGLDNFCVVDSVPNGSNFSGSSSSSNNNLLNTHSLSNKQLLNINNNNVAAGSSSSAQSGNKNWTTFD